MSYRITELCTGCSSCIQVCPVDAITGERKALHHIDPRKCIECGACGRICPFSAIEDDAGRIVQKNMSRKKWPKPHVDTSRCISCGTCVDVCVTSCLAMGDGKPGGLEAYPFLAHPKECVSCGWCETYCPADCIVLKEGGSNEGN